MASLLRISPLLALGLAAASVAVPRQAAAHAIESSLHYLNGSLELSSSFSSGEPAKDAVVRLLKADGSPGQELGRMGEDGRLALTLPPDLRNGRVDLQVDGGPGHRDYLELPVRNGQVQLDQVSEQPHGHQALFQWAGITALLGSAGLVVSVRRSRRSS
ncbi:MAG: hypothetical protein RLZZ216_1594 [Cyanobacteriota bacterium]|jgi:hypothetical protein